MLDDIVFHLSLDQEREVILQKNILGLGIYIWLPKGSSPNFASFLRELIRF